MPDTNFNIPTDTYSWSGLPKQHREGLLSSIMPQLQTAAGAYPGTVTAGFDKARGTLGELSNLYQAMPGQVSGYMGRQMRGFKDVAAEAGQGLLNQLAGRNMLGSSMAGDAGVQLMKGLNQQGWGKLADLGYGTTMTSQLGLADVFNQLAKLDIGETEMLGEYPGLLAQIAALGRGTEDPFQPYQAFLNFMGAL